VYAKTREWRRRIQLQTGKRYFSGQRTETAHRAQRGTVTTACGTVFATIGHVVIAAHTHAVTVVAASAVLHRAHHVHAIGHSRRRQ